MSTDPIVVDGALVPSGFPDTVCYTSFKKLLEDLPNFFKVQIPKSITNVIVSNVQPLEKDRNSIWFKLNNAGIFIGICVFSGGTWVQMFPVPNELPWIFGDSREVPEGYALADENNKNLPTGLGAYLRDHWKLHSSGAYYEYFQVTYIGL